MPDRDHRIEGGEVLIGGSALSRFSQRSYDVSVYSLRHIVNINVPCLVSALNTLSLSGMWDGQEQEKEKEEEDQLEPGTTTTARLSATLPRQRRWM